MSGINVLNLQLEGEYLSVKVLKRFKTRIECIRASHVEKVVSEKPAFSQNIGVVTWPNFWGAIQ